MSTSSVKGTIKNAKGIPVADAVVIVVQGSGSFTEMASVTNDSGEFYLSNLTLPGHYVLQIQAPGQTIQKEVELTANKEIEVDL